MFHFTLSFTIKTKYSLCQNRVERCITKFSQNLNIFQDHERSTLDFKDCAKPKISFKYFISDFLPPQKICEFCSSWLKL